ncbi:MAG TPA: hypothetical protein VFI25_00850 [Planctomycetota bacterium]|jgi:hypothetical protein|nr:hypothetical protein [Planctomycetota bacterium]
MMRTMKWSWLGPVLAVASLAAPASAQPCAAGGTPATVITGYTVSTSPHALASIVGNPAAFVLFSPATTGVYIDDHQSSPIAFGFPFPFFSPNASSFQVSNNGWIAIDQAYGNLGALAYQNAPIPTVAAPNNAFFVWWDDMIIPLASPGSVSYLIAGTAPNQTVTVEWDQEESWAGVAGGGNGDLATFQAVMHEGTGVVDFHYDPAGILGASQYTATVGYETTSGGSGGDLTGLGALNSLFPATDFTLTPSGFTTTGTVIPSYTVTTSAASYTSITGAAGEIVTWVGLAPTGADCGACPGGTAPAIPGTDDDNTGAIPMPFPFKYFLASATAFGIDSNGFLSINGGGCGGYMSQSPGTPGAAGNAGPWWDDLSMMAPTGRVSRLVTGPPGNQQLVVQWEDLTAWANYPGPTPGCVDPSNRLSFQVVLSQGSNNIEFRYAPEVPCVVPPPPLGTCPAVGAAVGITDLTGIYGADGTGLGTANLTLPTTNILFDPCEPCGEMSTFGPGCGPIIANSGGSATPGNLAYALTESSAPAGSFGLLFLGFSNTLLFGVVPLPFPIAGFGFLGGCSILVDPTISVGVAAVSGAGAASIGIPIPPGTPSCAGPIFAQWFNVVPPATVISSNGAAVITG